MWSTGLSPLALRFEFFHGGPHCRFLRKGRVAKEKQINAQVQSRELQSALVDRLRSPVDPAMLAAPAYYRQFYGDSRKPDIEAWSEVDGSMYAASLDQCLSGIRQQIADVMSER